MEYILYIILMTGGDGGASVDSQRFESLKACEAAKEVISSALRDQADFFNKRGVEKSSTNLQIRCVPTSLAETSDG